MTSTEVDLLDEPDDSDDDRSDQPALLTHLKIEGLFHRYSYDLEFPSKAVAQHLAIIYGDNGTGKTTILRLLWHLFSPANNRHHRVTLRSLPFRSLEATLSNGVKLRADKGGGPFLIHVTDTDGSEFTSDWSPGNDVFESWELDQLRESQSSFPEELKKRADNAINRARYIEFLTDLGVRPIYLADDRNVYSDDLELKATPSSAARRRLQAQEGPSQEESQGLVAQELDASMKRASDMLVRLAFGGTSQGSASANSVYLEVLQRIASTGEVGSEDQIRPLMTELNKIGTRSAGFQELGLVPRFDASAFKDVLGSIPQDRVGIAIEVLEPYLSSLTARLDALQDAQSLIKIFLEQANGFLTDKHLLFSQRRGLKIQVDGTDESLDAGQLSSGERQLVLLLCNALLARRGTRLFIIDEPELSLNVKWQRRIVPALVAVTAGTPVQFLIATHSIEVLSDYRENIIRLEEVSNA